MDEVITCACGCQAWIIGANFTRCSECSKPLLPSEVQAKVSEVNRRMKRATPKKDHPHD